MSADPFAAVPGPFELAGGQPRPQLGESRSPSRRNRACAVGQLGGQLVQLGREQLPGQVGEVSTAALSRCAAKSRQSATSTSSSASHSASNGSSSASWSRALTTASCALVRSSKCATSSSIQIGRVERLEHVRADEVVEVADRLHRHGLVEQVHRLLRLDAEPAPEVAAVLGEVIVHSRAGLA